MYTIYLNNAIGEDLEYYSSNKLSDIKNKINEWTNFIENGDSIRFEKDEEPHQVLLGEE